MSCPRSCSEAEKERSKFFLLTPFALLRPSTDGMIPIHTGEATCFPESTNSNVNLTSLRNVYSGHTMARQVDKKLTITRRHLTFYQNIKF